MVLWCWNWTFCYFTLGGCWGPGSEILWYYLNIKASWLEMGPVPPQCCTLTCQGVIASLSVSGTCYCANLPFILCWKKIDFLTNHQWLLGLCLPGLVIVLGVLRLQSNKRPVPPQWCTLACQDVIASLSVSGTCYCANLPFILCWKKRDFLTNHQWSLGLFSPGSVIVLGVLCLQSNKKLTNSN